MKKYQIKNLTKPLRVYLFIDSYFPMRDGTTVVVDSLARSFLKLGIEPIVIAPKKYKYSESYPYRILRNSSFLKRSDYPFSTLFLSKKIKKEIKSYDGPYLFNVHSPYFLGSSAVRFAKKHDIPCVYTLHTKLPQDCQSMFKNHFLANLEMKFIIRTINRANLVLSISQSACDELVPLKFNQKYRLVRNGASFDIPKNLDELTTSWRNKLYINKDDNVISFVGHMTWQKNLKLVFDTLKQLDELSFPYKFLIVGTGNYENEIIEYAKKLDLKGTVKFIGPLMNTDDVASIYKMSNLLFFPSFFDTFGLVVHEAALFSLPSLLAKGSDAASYISDNVNGFVEDALPKAMANRIIELFKDKEKMRQVGAKAKDTVPLCWDEIAKKYQRYYEQLIKEKVLSVSKDK